MKSPSVLFVTRREILTFSSIFWIVFISVSYVVFTLFLLNYRFVLSIIETNYSFSYKVSILSSLLGGLFTAFSPQDSAILLINAVLVGINMLLVTKTIYTLGHRGKVHLSIGGTTLIGFISAGCSSCGFSVLSILGLSTSLSFLPFHGIGLHILTLGILFFSAFYMLKKIRDGVYCKIK